MADPHSPETSKPTDKSQLPVHAEGNDQLSKSAVHQQLDDFKHAKSLPPADKSEKQSERTQSQEVPALTDSKRPEIHKILPEIEAWTKLGTPRILCPADKSPAMLHQFRMKHSAMDLVVADMNTGSWQIRPAIHLSLEPTSRDGAQDKATCVINGGYFGGHSSMADATIDGKVVVDLNKELHDNPKLKDRADAINSRSEIRVVKDKDKQTRIEIVRHTDPVPAGCEIIQALQGGPNLLDKNGKYDPQAIADEGFIKKIITKHGDEKDKHVISDDSPDARTAIGITAHGHLLMLTVAGKHHLQPSRGVTMKELAGIMKDLGCVQALNLDGGSSTTMYVRTSPGVSECTIQPGIDVNSNKPERPVKSFLELVPVEAQETIAKTNKSVTK